MQCDTDVRFRGLSRACACHIKQYRKRCWSHDADNSESKNEVVEEVDPCPDISIDVFHLINIHNL